VGCQNLWTRFSQEDAWFGTVYEDQSAFLEVYRSVAGETEPNIAQILVYAQEHGIS